MNAEPVVMLRRITYFKLIENKEIHEDGSHGGERQVTPQEWYDRYQKNMAKLNLQISSGRRFPYPKVILKYPVKYRS